MFIAEYKDSLQLICCKTTKVQVDISLYPTASIRISLFSCSYICLQHLRLILYIHTGLILPYLLQAVLLCQDLQYLQFSLAISLKVKVGYKYFIHTLVYFTIYLLTSCSLIYQAVYLLVCPKGASELSPQVFPSSLPLALIKQLVKEGVQSVDRYSCIVIKAVFLKVRLISILYQSCIS